MPLSHNIFRARPQDLSLARQAVVGLHNHTPGDDVALLAFLSDPNGYLLLATKGEQVIGSLSGFALRHAFRSEPAFLLYEIDVHPSARRNGIGTALVRQFINEAEMARAYEVWVLTNQSNTPAMSMYTRCGLSRRNLDDVMLEIALSGPGDSHT